MNRTIDKTASRRVAAYRARQSTELGFERIEVRASHRDRLAIQRFANTLRQHRNALSNNRDLAFILGTINAPRPHPIDGETLLDCLLADRPSKEWAPHMEALFSEVSIEALHRLVLSGACGFEDLRHAAYIWRIDKNERTAWIEEMASLSLARHAERHSADLGSTSPRL